MNGPRVTSASRTKKVDLHGMEKRNRFSHPRPLFSRTIRDSLIAMPQKAAKACVACDRPFAPSAKGLLPTGGISGAAIEPHILPEEVRLTDTQTYRHQLARSSRCITEVLGVLFYIIACGNLEEASTVIALHPDSPNNARGARTPHRTRTSPRTLSGLKL